jgi:hypothetical protein
MIPAADPTRHQQTCSSNKSNQQQGETFTALSPGQHQFVPARKALANADDLKRFLESDACRDYIAWVLCLNQAGEGEDQIRRRESLAFCFLYPVANR